MISKEQVEKAKKKRRGLNYGGNLRVMTRYVVSFVLLLSAIVLLSGCGPVMVGQNQQVLLGNLIGTPEEEMKQQLIQPIGYTCEVVATIASDGDSELKACGYIISFDQSDNWVYFYKGKYVGHGDKKLFPAHFVLLIENEILKSQQFSAQPETPK